MHAPSSTDLATTGDPLRARIAHWRETRSDRGGAMPAGLWAEAIVLARRHGVGPTARVLRIDYASLKRRLTTDGASATDARPTFVEVGAVAALSLGPCVIAIDGRRGRRLRLEVSGLRVPDLVAVMHVAWGRRG
jgi:hypothetical protein